MMLKKEFFENIFFSYLTLRHKLVNGSFGILYFAVKSESQAAENLVKLKQTKYFNFWGAENAA